MIRENVPIMNGENHFSEEQTVTLEQALGIAVQHHTVGDLSKAGTIYEQILQTNPNHTDALHLLGVIAHQVGDNERAVGLIKKAIDLKPNFAEAHSNLGNTLKGLGKLDEAVTSYHRALSIKSDYAEAHNNLGTTFRELGQLDKSVACYHKALAIKADYAEAHNNLGVAFQELGRLDEAVTHCQKAIAIRPDYAEAHSNLGNTLKGLGKLDEAVTSYHKALSIKPDYAEAHNNLGATFKELGQLDDAVTHFNRALEIKPNYIDAYDNRGHAIDLQRGNKPFDHEAALDQCLSAVSQDNFDDATAILHHVCLNSPYKTPTFIKQFIDACCEAITRMLDNRKFDIAGNRIRRLFMLIEVHKPFDILMQRYVDETKNENLLETLDTHENAVYLSMQSSVLYQNGQYDEAERCARQCIENTKVLLESETQRNEGWFLVRKNLNNIKDSEKARVILEELLLGIEI